MATTGGRRRAGTRPGRGRDRSSPAGRAADADEVVRLGFIPLGAVVAAPIILLLVTVGVSWWLAAATVVPATLVAAHLSMPRRSLRVGPDLLALREGRRPEVRLALSEIEEVERVWVLRAGYHLEFRAAGAIIEIRGLGTFSEPFLHEVGARLLRTASPQLRWGPVERRLLGIAE